VEKLIENVKRDKRKLVKHLKKNNLKMKNTTHTKQEHTHVKNLKRQLMTKDFLWRLKLHVGNWNEWLLVLRTWFSVLSGGRSVAGLFGNNLNIYESRDDPVSSRNKSIDFKVLLSA